MSAKYRSVISHGFMTMGVKQSVMRGLHVQEIQTDVCRADINETIYIVEITRQSPKYHSKEWLLWKL